MSQYSPIRTDNADLNRVQDRIRDTASATTSRLNSLQTQITAAGKVTVATTSVNAIASPDIDVTIVLGGASIVLPDATKVSRQLRYKNTSGSSTVLLSCISVGGVQQQIDGNTTLTIPISTTVAIVSDGQNYHTI